MEEKLKNVLILSPYYNPEPFPINSFVESLKNKTSQVTIITSIPNYRKYGYYKNYSIFGPYCEISKNLKIIRLPVIPRFNNNFFGIFLFYLSFFLLSFLFLLFYSIFNRGKYNHFMSFCGSPVYVGFLGIFYSKLIGCKNSLWIQDIWPEAIQSTIGLKYNFLQKIINKIQDIMWKNTDIIFSQSDSLTIFLKNKYRNLNVFTLLNPSRENAVNENKYKSRDIANKKIKVFSYLGNIGKAQSIDLFLDSFQSINNDNFKLNMCGDGSALENFKKEYTNSNFIWHGWIEGQKLDDLINETDFFILSLNSYGRQSLIIPSKLQTYFRYNKPILCLSSGASSDLVVNTNTGLVCDNLDKDNVVKTINNMINLDEEIYNIMSNNCYNYYIKMLSPDKIADDFIKHI